MIEIYTDGACSAKNGHGPGGAAACVLNKDGERSSSPVTLNCQDTTNQQMELSAVIIGLAKTFSLITIIPQIYEEDCKAITVNSDSAYVINCMNQHWYVNWLKNGWKNSKKQPVANRELWELLLKLLKVFNSNKYKITFNKVKGHSDNKYNNFVDKLAVEVKENTFSLTQNYEELVQFLRILVDMVEERLMNDRNYSTCI